MSDLIEQARLTDEEAKPGREAILTSTIGVRCAGCGEQTDYVYVKGDLCERCFSDSTKAEEKALSNSGRRDLPQGTRLNLRLGRFSVTGAKPWQRFGKAAYGSSGGKLVVTVFVLWPFAFGWRAKG